VEGRKKLGLAGHLELLLLISSHPHSTDITVLAEEFLQAALECRIFLTKSFLSPDGHRRFFDLENDENARHRHSSRIGFLVLGVQLFVEP
jgi:hypothetical protein